MKSGSLCPTDARLRPDILCLENGDLEGASREKTRLEEKQRDSRKLLKSTNGKDFSPRQATVWYIQKINNLFLYLFLGGLKKFTAPIQKAIFGVIVDVIGIATLMMPTQYFS